MCYRYSIFSRPELLESRFKAKFEKQFIRRYHVSAFEQTTLPVITNDKPDTIQLFSWGLVPFWVKNQQQMQEIAEKTANARSETIYEKPAFRTSAQKKHCLVLANGFYEWRNFQGKNYPYYIRLKSKEPFAIAGLWEAWTNKETEKEVKSYTIITTRANELMEKVHNKKKRMPVILSKELERSWIAKDVTKDEALQILEPIDDSVLEAFTISRMITARGVDPDVPEILNPYEYPELADLNKSVGQTSLF